MRRRIAFVICLFSFLALGAAGSLGAETLRIGVFLHPPIVMQKTPDGPPYGPGVEYAKAVALALGYEPKIELLPIARLLSYIANGSLDMALELAMNDDRKAFVYYPDEPCFITHTALTVRADNPLKAISSVKDISGMRIGYLLGAYTGSFFAGVSDVTFDYVSGENSIAQNLSKLLAGRIDAILDQNEYSSIAEARRQGMAQKIRVLPLPGNAVKGYVVFSRAGPNADALLRAYNALNGTPALPNETSLVLESLK
jgi:polar amino acid transport system substrate-binding protein